MESTETFILWLNILKFLIRIFFSFFIVFIVKMMKPELSFISLQEGTLVIIFYRKSEILA